MSPMLPLFVLLLLPSLPLVTCDDDVTMQSLMTLVQQQAASIQTMQARMTSMENGAQQSQVAHQTLQATVASLQNGAQQSLATQQTLQSKVASLESGVQQSLATERQHTGQIAAINSRLNTQVFFNAHMSQYQVDIGTNNGPMKFDAVTSNVGNGYNPQTGVFTAPVTGTYVMYTQIMKDSNQGVVHYVIDKSGTILCFNAVDTANDYDKSSCLASVHLQKGETVIVRRHDGGQRLAGLALCAFSGFLLSADAS